MELGQILNHLKENGNTVEPVSQLRDSVREFDAGIFTWEGNHGTADASDLDYGRFIIIATQLFDDACDVGFFLVSPRTGQKVLFTFLSEETDRHGEVQWWTYQSWDMKYTVQIFND